MVAGDGKLSLADVAGQGATGSRPHESSDTLDMLAQSSKTCLEETLDVASELMSPAIPAAQRSPVYDLLTPAEALREDSARCGPKSKPKPTSKASAQSIRKPSPDRSRSPVHVPESPARSHGPLPSPKSRNSRSPLPSPENRNRSRSPLPAPEWVAKPSSKHDRRPQEAPWAPPQNLNRFVGEPLARQLFGPKARPPSKASAEPKPEGYWKPPCLISEYHVCYIDLFMQDLYTMWGPYS